MKRFFCSSSLLLLVIAAMAGCGKKEPADELGRIREAKFLHIAVDPVNLPFCYAAGRRVSPISRLSASR